MIERILRKKFGKERYLSIAPAASRGYHYAQYTRTYSTQLLLVLAISDVYGKMEWPS